jgi:hypothetical protein
MDADIIISFLYNLPTERKINTIIYVCLRFHNVSWFVVYLTTLSLTKRKLMYIQSPTGQEMNPARNEIDAHAQDFVANELLLSILQA